jgi:neopullulanase
MTKLDRWSGVSRAFIAGLLLSLLAACAATPPVPETAPEVSTSRAQRGTDWREEVIYFALTDRFANGNPRNDDGAPGSGDDAEPQNPLGWHGGDFAGISQKIREGYFQQLGFTAIWISPVVLQVPAIPVADGPNQGRMFAGYHGYWAEDFVTVDPHFGTLKELKQLVRLAHSRGLKIIQDVVVNHAGYGAALVTEKPAWFNDEADCAAATNRDQDCPLAGLPDFDQSNPEVVAFLNDFVDYWVDEVGIDGIRMDTVKHVEDSYWRQFFAAGGPGDPREVWTVGEIFSGDVGFLAYYLDDLGLPSAFDFPLYFRIKDHLSSPGGNLDDVAVIFDQDGLYSDPSRLVTFIDNHDVPRFMSEAVNRGVPLEAARERLDLALSLIYTVRGTPSVYYGTEIAMLGGGDPYNFPLGESNREDMDFSQVAASPLSARLKALADARERFPALTHGVQQELWRPNGGAPVLAFRRTLEGEQPVVAVMNNGDAPLELSSLPGGGIPLLGTFALEELSAAKHKHKACRSNPGKGQGKPSCGLREVTGRSTNLSIDTAGRLVGTLPARTLLAVSAPAGTGGAVNPELGNVTDLTALPGDSAVKLSWEPTPDPAVQGYRVYYRTAAGAETLFNFAPLPRDAREVIVYGPQNGVRYSFRVVSVDAAGAESSGAPTVEATPTADATARVTFSVDARSQGEGPIELRRFDTGAQIEYPLAQGEKGVWSTTVELPLFRTISFKFGNTAPNAKNSGYEGDGQPDRRLTLDAAELSYSGTYDFITVPVPDAAIEGTVTATGTGRAGALVDSSTDPRTAYALTFADGSYYLPLASGTATDLTVRAAGYEPVTRSGVTAPATGVDFDLGGGDAVGYTIDGDLSEWTAPRATLTNDADGYDGGFGPDNLLNRVLLDWDETNLYLAYTYRAAGNSAILHLDLRPGGIESAEGFNAWRRLASFNEPIDFFLAQYQGQGVELREVVSSTQTTQLAGFESATDGAAPAYTTEVAIPWSVLGYSAPPSTTLNLYGGIYGGDGYGAGDILPHAGSSPAVSGNVVATGSSDNRRVTFAAPFTVALAP